MWNGLKMIMKDEVIKMRCCDKKRCCKSSIFDKLFSLDAYDEDYSDEYCDLTKADVVRENVKDKLLTDESMTFEEYLTLLEIVKSKFKTCFGLKNGKYELLFREIPLEGTINLKLKKDKEESENKEDEREYRD